MKDKRTEVGEIRGFLGEGTEFEGTLKFQDVMRIDGRFKGKIFSQNTLIIGEPAEVDAEIEVSTVSISGKVKGTIKADVRLELHSTARVFGDVFTTTLVIEEGGFLQGSCQMGDLKEMEKAPPRKVESLPLQTKGSEG